MPNDTNTLNGALQELGETMADNLVSMGVVDASASDGLTTLAGKILDIEPSIGGLDLDTAVTIASSESSITLGNSIVLTSKLTASYDDETIVDVDLSGVLQNATLLFKNGNTTIGTAVTDVNGVATFTYTPPAIGTLSLKAIFAGTDNFNNCESSFINVTVVAPSYDGVVVSSDKDILSYYDSDSCTLSAQLMDGSSTASVSGVEVEFFNGSTSLGTAETNNSGVATLSYDSQGIGDMSITASVGIISSETYTIEDCLKVYTGTYLTGTGTVTQALNYNLPSTFEIEYGYKLTSFNQANSTYLRIGETDSKALLIGRVGNDSQYSVWVRNSGDTKHWGSNIQTSNDYQTLTITYDGSSFIFNNDITVTDLKGVSLSKLLNLNGWHDTSNQGTIKDIKIKPL